MNIFRSSCPVAKVTLETFAEHVHVGGETRKVEFTKEITWLRESESQLLYMHGGKVVEEGATHNDYYGFLSSCEMDGPTPAEVCKHFSVTAESSLEVIVRTTVFLRPAHVTPECAEVNRTKPENYKSQYAYIPDNWRKEVVVDGDRMWPALEREELAVQVTWSSKHTEAENAALLAALRARFIGAAVPVEA